jgi:hypothetical protein
MGTIQIFGSIVMIAIFSIMIVGFAISFAANNDVSVSVNDDPNISKFNTDSKTNIGGIKSDANSEYASIVNTTIPEGGDYPKSMGAFAITDESTFAVTKNVVSVAYLKLFGNDPTFGYVFTAGMGFLGIIMALYVYKTIRGMPD